MLCCPANRPQAAQAGYPGHSEIINISGCVDQLKLPQGSALNHTVSWLDVLLVSNTFNTPTPERPKRANLTYRTAPMQLDVKSGIL